MNKRYAKKIAPGMRLLDEAELDAVIGGYVAPSYAPFSQFNASSMIPLADPTWALVGALR